MRQSSPTPISAVTRGSTVDRWTDQGQQITGPIDREGFLADQAAWLRAMRGYVEAVRAFNARGMATSRAAVSARQVASVAPVAVDIPKSDPTARSTLTRRQNEIAVLIARGSSNAEIAEALTITPGTAGNHVAQILRRLGCKSRAQVAVWAVQRGLLSDTSTEP
jgi:DNA-binding CsgD family transcriptional regulator